MYEALVVSRLRVRGRLKPERFAPSVDQQKGDSMETQLVVPILTSHDQRIAEWHRRSAYYLEFMEDFSYQ